MKFVKKISNVTLAIIVVFIGIGGGIFVKLFLVNFFVIPTSSMVPALYPGDHVLVSKWGYHSFFAEEGCKGECRKVKRNDIIVFNSPWNKVLKKIEIDRNLFWVKRCIAVPGDTLCIIKGRYIVNGEKIYGDTTAQIKFYQNRVAYSNNLVLGKQQDSLVKWTLWSYGPFVIPGEGIEIELTLANQFIYGEMIQYENPEFRMILGGKYLFKNNWYFMAGDNVANSFDSRYWGCMPEECIQGKVLMVVYSRNILDGEFRKERFFKRINYENF